MATPPGNDTESPATIDDDVANNVALLDCLDGHPVNEGSRGKGERKDARVEKVR